MLPYKKIAANRLRFAAMCSEQRDLNPRPTAPKAAALAKLRYTPKLSKSEKKDNTPVFFGKGVFVNTDKCRV